MPVPSQVAISVGGNDITSYVMFQTASFESQINAVPGSFEFTCRDPEQVLSFTTGSIVLLDIDNVRMFGGYLTSISHKFAFPTADTSGGAAAVKTRFWLLRGVDFNTLFDKRIMRYTTDYLSQFPQFGGDVKDGYLIRNFLPVYLDIPEVDASTYVEDIICTSSVTNDPLDPQCQPGSTPGNFVEQGTIWRKQMEEFASISGAVWYMDASLQLHYHPIETFTARWGFSDVPNSLPVDGDPPGVFAGATYGFREGSAVEDGSNIINDAFIWGGNMFSGAAGGTVFARTQNATSITDHGDWQYAETHFGDSNFASQDLVEVRGAVIVSGQPGSVGGDTNRGLSHEQWRVDLKWFAHDVPLVAGSRDHLMVGNLVVIELQTFGLTGVDALVLPMRQVRVTFPTLSSEDGQAFVAFEGTFALQLDDPYTIWRYLLKQHDRITQSIVATVNSSSPSVVYGAVFYDLATEAADGVRTVFSIPFGYIPGTLQVIIDGNEQTPVVSFAETNSLTGTFTCSVAPLSGADVLVLCKVTG